MKAILRAGALMVALCLLLGMVAPAFSQAPLVHTYDVQGVGHISPLVGQRVRDVPGIVTDVRTNGFTIQDPDGDGDSATSDAVFVFTRERPTVALGDSVQVSGEVQEFRPGDDAELSLAITEIVGPRVTVLGRRAALPTPVLLGPYGRSVPARLSRDGEAGNIEALPGFDPATNAVDFFESLEGMRVQVNDAVAVGRRANSSEIPVLPEDGAGVARRTARGGLLAPLPGEASPRLLLADGMVRTPPASVGDRFPGTTVGVLEYAPAGPRVRVSEIAPIVLGGIEAEQAEVAGPDDLSVATFNVENLSPRERPQKLAALAHTIVERLGAPDLLAIQEVQDDSGTSDDGTVSAASTARGLIAAIRAVGGPSYTYLDIPPENDQDGGALGANIRVGLLMRTDRGLALVNRPGGDARTPASVVVDAAGPSLSVSPGRIEPDNGAWLESRKPLVAEFTLRGQKLFVIGCHFVSKLGDQPTFGRFQPPARLSEAQRVEQARLVHAFAATLLATDPGANVIVLGDLNDVSGSAPLASLTGDLLTDVLDTLPEEERYSYVFGGQSEAIDHLAVSPSLLGATVLVDVVHANAEILGAASDHDPVLTWFRLPSR